MKRLASAALAALLLTAPAAFAQDATPAAPEAPAGGPPPLPVEPDVTEDAGGPPPLPPQAEYYIGENGAQVGPLSEDELAERIADGRVTGRTLVWMEGMAEWQAASAVPEVAVLIAGTSGPAAGALVPAEFIAGTWTTSGPMPIPGIGNTDASLTSVYNADGTVTGSGSLEATVPGTAGGRVRFEVGIEGRWRVEPISDTSFRMILDGTTIVSAPSMGITDQRQPMRNQISTIEIIDENTIRDETGTISRRES
jgi:hypothetical protein